MDWQKAMRETVSAYKRQIQCETHTLSGHQEIHTAMNCKEEMPGGESPFLDLAREHFLQKFANNLLIDYPES